MPGFGIPRSATSTIAPMAKLTPSELKRRASRPFVRAGATGAAPVPARTATLDSVLAGQERVHRVRSFSERVRSVPSVLGRTSVMVNGRRALSSGRSSALAAVKMSDTSRAITSRAAWSHARQISSACLRFAVLVLLKWRLKMPAGVLEVNAQYQNGLPCWLWRSDSCWNLHNSKA